jgi:hypothetical protein
LTKVVIIYPFATLYDSIGWWSCSCHPLVLPCLIIPKSLRTYPNMARSMV